MRRHAVDSRTTAALRDASVLALYEALHDVTGWGLSVVAAYVRRGRNDDALAELRRIVSSLDPATRNDVYLAQRKYLTDGAAALWAEVAP